MRALGVAPAGAVGARAAGVVRAGVRAATLYLTSLHNSNFRGAIKGLEPLEGRQRPHRGGPSVRRQGAPGGLLSTSLETSTLITPPPAVFISQEHLEQSGSGFIPGQI